MFKDFVNFFVDFKCDVFVYFFFFVDFKYLIEVERVELLVGQCLSLLISESVYMDSYVEGSRDEIERLFNGQFILCFKSIDLGFLFELMFDYFFLFEKKKMQVVEKKVLMCLKVIDIFWEMWFF